MKNALLFDMDGVTLDTEPLYTAAELRLFKEYGVIIPEKDYYLFRGCSEKSFYTLSMKKYNIDEKIDVFIEKGRKYVNEEFNDNLSFMDGFVKLHSIAKKNNFFIGLVTAAPYRTIKWVNNKINLDQYFMHIISGDDVDRNKPYPDPYLAMMKFANILPQQTIIIEDSGIGITSALSSGAHVIGKRGSVPEKLIKNAHIIVSHLNEITSDVLEDLLHRKL